MKSFENKNVNADTSTFFLRSKENVYVCALSEVPKLSSYAKAEDKLFKYLFGNYQKWVRPVDHLNQTIRVKFGLAISQLVDVVRIEMAQE